MNAEPSHAWVRRAAIPMVFIISCLACDRLSAQQPGHLTAFHRSGQTFLTWNELEELAGEHYRVYRHTAPIDETSLSEAVALAVVEENSSWHARENARFIIEDLGDPLPADRGLFVHTAQDTGTFYYAITLITNTVENQAEFGPDNSLTTGIAEQPDQPEPVLIRTEGNSRVYTQFMDYQNWNATFNGYAYNYAVNIADDVSPDTPAPVFLYLHQRSNKYSVQDEPRLDAPGIEISVDDPDNTWHYGFSATWDFTTGDNPESGPIVNFTELRHLRAIDEVIRNPDYLVDTNRIYVFGSSMGGSGALSMGLRYPNVFAAAFCWQPMTDYRAAAEGGRSWDLYPKWGSTTANLPVENRGVHAEHLAVHDGTGVYDWMNHVLQVESRPGDESAYIFFHHGKNDNTIAWPAQGEAFPEAMYRGRRGFHAMIDGSSHMGIGWLDPDHNATPNWHFKLANFTRDSSFPAFSMATGDAPVPPPSDNSTNLYNQTLEWSSAMNDFAGEIVDTPTHYAIALRSTSTTQTARVTLRRLIAFPSTPGDRVIWRNTGLADDEMIGFGILAVDPNGLISLPNVTIEATGNLLEFFPDEPPETPLGDPPAIWYEVSGLDPEDPMSDPEADYDGSGLINRHEYWAGTNPQDAASRFSIFALDYDGLSWLAAPGFAYVVEFSSDLEEWVSLADPYVAEEMEEAIPLPESAHTQGFFRILIDTP